MLPTRNEYLCQIDRVRTWREIQKQGIPSLILVGHFDYDVHECWAFYGEEPLDEVINTERGLEVIYKNGYLIGDIDPRKISIDDLKAEYVCAIKEYFSIGVDEDKS